MKISAKQYAQALYESLEGKNRNEIKSVIVEFAKVLAADNGLSKTAEIVEKFNKIYNQEEGIVEAEISSAKKLQKNLLNELAGYIKKISQAKKVEILETEDKNLLGGIVIKFGDKVLDGSLKTKLSLLKKELKK